MSDPTAAKECESKPSTQIVLSVPAIFCSFGLAERRGAGRPKTEDSRIRISSLQVLSRKTIPSREPAEQAAA